MTQSRGGRIRIAITHPQFGRGGSEAAALWDVQALKGDCEISIITGRLGDLGELNAFYGTALAPTDFRLRLVPQPKFLHETPSLAALRGALYQRFCRSIAHEFDVLISCYNICDFGRPAIQRIADFSFAPEIARSLHPLPPGARMFYRDGLLRRAYLGFCRLFGRPSGRDPLTQDMVLANSRWTADLLRRHFGTQAEVLYPPVADGFPDVPWEKRENGFVCLGRVAPEKRIENIIDILARMRAAGNDVHLHVVGAIGDDSYGSMIRRKCQENAAWVQMDGPLYGQAKAQMLSAHRFGLHGCQGEAFGIAVAEMVKAGCIPVVPQEGGQAEIVDDAAMMYDGIDDGVAKVCRILKSAQEQARLREHLRGQAGKFSAERFMDGMRKAVARFQDEQGAVR